MDNQPNWIVTILVNAVSIVALTYVLKGVEVRSFLRAVIVAIVLSLLNATLGGMLDFVSFSIVTFFVNALMVLLASKLLDGFHVRNIWWAIIFGILLSFLNGWLFDFLGYNA